MINVFSDLPEAIILCGGKGERLRPITKDVPKPLVKINNKPILHYVIEHLKQYDIGNINIGDSITVKNNNILLDHRKNILDSFYYVNISRVIDVNVNVIIIFRKIPLKNA